MRECLIRPSLSAGARPASAGYTRIWVYRPVPYRYAWNRPVPCGWGYNLIDLSLVGVRLNRPVPWTPGLATDVPPESGLCRHGEPVATRAGVAGPPPSGSIVVLM